LVESTFDQLELPAPRTLTRRTGRRPLKALTNKLLGGAHAQNGKKAKGKGHLFWTEGLIPLKGRVRKRGKGGT